MNEPHATFSECSSSLHHLQIPVREPLARLTWHVLWLIWSGRSQNVSFLRTLLYTSTRRVPVWQGCKRPRRILEFSVSFKGTLELLRAQEPLIAECIALSQTLLQKRSSGGLAANAVSQSLFVIQCLLQGHFNGDRQRVECTWRPVRVVCSGSLNLWRL